MDYVCCTPRSPPVTPVYVCNEIISARDESVEEKLLEKIPNV